MRITLRQIFIIFFLVTGLYAQFPGDDEHPGRGMSPEDRRERRFNRREKIEELRIWKMTNYLDLSSEQAMQFFPLLKEHEEDLYTVVEKQHKVMEKLVEKSKDESFNPSDKEIEKIITTLEKYDTMIKEKKANFIINQLEFLTNQQKVKYIVFDSRFKSHLLRALKEHNQK